MQSQPPPPPPGFQQPPQQLRSSYSSDVSPRRNKAGLIVMAVLLPIFAVVAIYAFVVAGGDSDSPNTTLSKYTMAQFNHVQVGMTHDEVTVIVGSSGTLVVDQEVVGITGQVYTYQNADGSNMQLQFQNGALISKAQFQLP